MRKLIAASFLFVFIPACGARPEPVSETQVVLLLEPALLPNGEYSVEELRSYLHRTARALIVSSAGSEVFARAVGELEKDRSIPHSHRTNSNHVIAWLRDNVRLTTCPPDGDELAHISVAGTSNDEGAQRIAFTVATALREAMVRSWTHDLLRKIKALTSLIESEESRLMALHEEAVKWTVPSPGKDEVYRDLLIRKLAEVRLELTVARAVSSFDTLPKGEFDAFDAGPPDPAAAADEEATERLKHNLMSLVLEVDELDSRIGQDEEAQEKSARIRGEIRRRNARVLELQEQLDRYMAVQEHHEPPIVVTVASR